MREPQAYMVRKIIFELCAETVDGCTAARNGGAARIELCSGLSEGGLTPSHGLIAHAVQSAGLPVHVLIRPRGGDFSYTESELAVMAEDIRHAKQLGVAGVVLGMLNQQRAVHIAHTRALVHLAKPMQVTFHRAFDETASLPEALEAIIGVGCDRVLTSGGRESVLAGAETLQALVRQASGRIDIAVGGGLRLTSAAEVARITGAEHFHGSLRGESDGAACTVDAKTVQAMIQQLQEA